MNALIRNQVSNARMLFQNGVTLPVEVEKYKFDLLISNALAAKAFEFVTPYIDQGLIETDIHQYKQFAGSVLHRMATQLQADEESLTFFYHFTEKVKNLDGTIEGKPLLYHFFNAGANVGLIFLLKDAGCDLFYKDDRDESYAFMIVRNSSLPAETRLLHLNYCQQQGMDLHAPNEDGLTPFRYAVNNGLYDFANFLLYYGADPNAQDKHGCSAFYDVIADKRSLQGYEVLRQYATPDFNQRYLHGSYLMTAFMQSLYGTEEQLTLMEKLIADGADLDVKASSYNGERSSVDLAAEKREEVLRRMIDVAGIDVNMQDNEGNTLLHKVCRQYLSNDREAAKETYRKVQLLLEKRCGYKYHQRPG